jgi:hypothetical protein
MEIWKLKPGSRVSIKTTFRDYDGQECRAGRELEVVSHDVFARENGHTLKFTDGSVIRLGGVDPDNDRVMHDFDDVYWELVQ